MKHGGLEGLFNTVLQTTISVNIFVSHGCLNSTHGPLISPNLVFAILLLSSGAIETR